MEISPAEAKKAWQAVNTLEKLGFDCSEIHPDLEQIFVEYGIQLYLDHGQFSVLHTIHHKVKATEGHKAAAKFIAYLVAHASVRYSPETGKIKCAKDKKKRTHSSDGSPDLAVMGNGE